MSLFDSNEWAGVVGRSWVPGQPEPPQGVTTTDGPVLALVVADAEGSLGFLWAATARGDEAAGFELAFQRVDQSAPEARRWKQLVTDAQQSAGWSPLDFLDYWWERLDDPSRIGARDVRAQGAPRNYPTLAQARAALLPGDDRPPAPVPLPRADSV